jgi:hypothetical protein
VTRRKRPAPPDRPFPNSNSYAQSNATSSKQVSFWEVHTYVLPDPEWYGQWPTVGTPEWVALDDDDPLKLVSLYDAARHWAFRLETCQEARCEASHDVSAAEDWPAIANEIRGRREAYIPRTDAS